MKLCAVLLAAGAVAGSLPPVTTPGQEAAMEEARRIAQSTAGQYRQPLLDMLGSAEFKASMKGFHAPQVEGKTPEEILVMLGQDWRAGEVTHNFHVIAPNTTGTGIDISAKTVIGHELFYNMWQILALDLWEGNVSYPGLQNAAQTELMNLPAIPPPLRKPTLEHASNRMLYGATNFMQRASGNTLFGGIGLVFNNEYIYNHTAISPVDTGLYEMVCKHRAGPNFSIPLNCTGTLSGTPYPLATFDHFEHAIYSNVWFWNSTLRGQKMDPYDNLATIVAMYTNEDYDAIPDSFANLDLAYAEANPLMNVRYNGGVKLAIFRFIPELFGTTLGRELQGWAVTNNIVVAWAWDPPTSMKMKPYQSNQRVLDPYVLSRVSSGRNQTSGGFPALSTAFDGFWKGGNSTEWEAVWTHFKGTALQAKPVGGRSCASLSCSAVRVVDNTCVCP
eukprot:Rhum_TRINITY_DN15407_c0_g1::Rhum_TRINITY_DN15407_c0_g1_i3::g.155588::m.155588